MSFEFMLGTAKKNITPKNPIQLAGFGHRKGDFEGILRSLYLKVMVFQTRGDLGKSSSALIVSADLIWWGQDRTPGILDRIEERWGIKQSAIILHATHTHSGPQTSNRFVDSIGVMDQHYVDFLEEVLFEGIDDAISDLESVTMEQGRGECLIGVNRRKKENGQIIMAPNVDGPVDPEFTVVQFLTVKGQQKAVLVHFSCHPTTTDLNMISSDFPGVAMEYLEQRMDPNAISVFMQGCSGDVRPNLVEEGQFFRGFDSDVIRFGEELAKSVLQVLKGPMKFLHPNPIYSNALTVSLPFQLFPELDGQQWQQINKDDEQHIKEWKQLLVNDSTRLQNSIPFQINIIRIGKGLSFLSMNGEVVTEYGNYIKKQSGGRVLPLGYSNGMIGYIPTAVQVTEGGYEADESHYYFGLPSKYSPLLEDIIKKGIQQLVHLEKGENP